MIWIKDRAARLRALNCAALRGALSPATLPTEVKDLGELGFVYAYVGAPELALDYEERYADAGRVAALGGTDFSLHRLRKYANRRGSRPYLIKAGVVEYSRAKGWPDPCRPTTDDDFECNRTSDLLKHRDGSLWRRVAVTLFARLDRLRPQTCRSVGHVRFSRPL